MLCQYKQPLLLTVSDWDYYLCTKYSSFRVCVCVCVYLGLKVNVKALLF